MIIDIILIFSSFICGIIYSYVTTTETETETILKYPTLENINNIKYIDDSGVCYKYKAVFDD